MPPSEQDLDAQIERLVSADTEGSSKLESARASASHLPSGTSSGGGVGGTGASVKPIKVKALPTDEHGNVILPVSIGKLSTRITICSLGS